MELILDFFFPCPTIFPAYQAASLSMQIGSSGLLFFFLFRAVPASYGSSQDGDRTSDVAAGLHHSHSNTRSKPHLRPIPYIAHGNARSLTYWVRLGIKPTSSFILVGFMTTESWWELPGLIFKWVLVLWMAGLEYQNKVRKKVYRIRLKSCSHQNKWTICLVPLRRSKGLTFLFQWNQKVKSVKKNLLTKNLLFVYLDCIM